MRLHRQYKENPFKKEVELKLKMEETRKISELSKTAMRVYLFIREYSFRTKGCILFDISMAKDICGFRQNKSIYNALNELVSADILAGTKDSVEFYYNPKFINNEKE
jgi:hypothetical protein